MISPNFIRGTTSNLDYWLGKTNVIDPDQFTLLEFERENVFQAVIIGLEIPDTRDKALKLVRQSFQLFEKPGHWRIWIPIVERAIATSSQDLILHCQFHNQLGHLYRIERRLKEALEIHQKAEELANAIDNPIQIANAQFGKCECYRHLRKFKEAEDFGQKALNIFIQAGVIEKVAAALNSLGLVSLGLEEWEKSEKQFQDSIFYWRKVNDPIELARTLNNISIIFERKGEVELAIKAIGEAEKLLEPTKFHIDKVMVKISLGTFYFNQKKYSLAEQVFRSADTIELRESGHLYYRAQLSHNLGDTLFKRAVYKEAKLYLILAIELWEREGTDKLMKANSVVTLAECLVATEEYQLALHWTDEGIGLLEDQSHPWAKRLLGKLKRLKGKVIKKLSS